MNEPRVKVRAPWLAHDPDWAVKAGALTEEDRTWFLRQWRLADGPPGDFVWWVTTDFIR